MFSLPTVLQLVNALVFISVSILIIFRVKEATGSLKLAKISIVLAAGFAAVAFTIEAIIGLSSSNMLLAEQLYVALILFTMLAVANLSSFAILATYGGSRRYLLVAISYIMALASPTFVAFTYNRLQFTFTESGLYDVSIPRPGIDIYIIFGAPLGLLPILILANSLITARRRGDKALSLRAASLLSTVTTNLILAGIYALGDTNWGMGALIAWIPATLLLLISFLRTTKPIEPQSKTRQRPFIHSEAFPSPISNLTYSKVNARKEFYFLTAFI
jgi:hypothetical protein